MTAPGLTPVKVAWLAGILEGEGSFYAQPDFKRGADPARLYPQIQVEMTDRDILDRIRAIVGRGPVSRGARSRAPERKPIYRYMLKGRTAIGLMFTVYPFLGQRRRGQVEAVVARWLAGPAPVLSQMRPYPAPEPLDILPKDREALRRVKGDPEAVQRVACDRGLSAELVAEQLARWRVAP